jgi:hypothetical protein
MLTNDLVGALAGAVDLGAGGVAAGTAGMVAPPFVGGEPEPLRTVGLTGAAGVGVGVGGAAAGGGTSGVVPAVLGTGRSTTGACAAACGGIANKNAATRAAAFVVRPETICCA